MHLLESVKLLSSTMNGLIYPSHYVVCPLLTPLDCLVEVSASHTLKKVSFSYYYGCHIYTVMVNWCCIETAVQTPMCKDWGRGGGG